MQGHGSRALAPGLGPQPWRRPEGFTLLELLVVMAVVAVLTSLAVGAARPSSEARAAEALRALLLSARHEALLRGRSVAVVQAPDGFESRAQAVSTAECGSGAVVGHVDLSQHAGVRVTAGWAAGGVVWLPTGSGRTCTGAGVISSTVVLSGPRGTAAVVVSSLGRVRVERR